MKFDFKFGPQNKNIYGVRKIKKLSIVADASDPWGRMVASRVFLHFKNTSDILYLGSVL